MHQLQAAATPSHFPTLSASRTAVASRPNPHHSATFPSAPAVRSLIHNHHVELRQGCPRTAWACRLVVCLWQFPRRSTIIVRCIRPQPGRHRGTLTATDAAALAPEIPLHKRRCPLWVFRLEAERGDADLKVSAASPSAAVAASTNDRLRRVAQHDRLRRIHDAAPRHTDHVSVHERTDGVLLAVHCCACSRAAATSRSTTASLAAHRRAVRQHRVVHHQYALVKAVVVFAMASGGACRASYCAGENL